MILLTGANGFIGAKLYQSLLSNQQSVLTYTSKIPAAQEATKLGKYKQEIAEIVFCGGYVQHSPSSGNLMEEATKSWFVLEQILKHEFNSLRQITYFSTTDVYKKSPQTVETSGTFASNLYTSTKLSQESFLHDFCTQRGIQLQIIRIGNVYGPGEGRRGKFIPSVIESAIRGREFKFFADPRSLIQPIYIDDLIIILQRILHKKSSFDVLNVAGAKRIHLSEVTEEVGKLKPFLISSTPNSPYFENTFNIERLSQISLGLQTELSQGLRREFDYENEKFSDFRP